MHVYTKTGDRGETGIIGRSRVSKDSALMRAIGNVDELNSMLAVLRSMEPPQEIENELKQIQNDLFVIGAILADPEKKSRHTPKLPNERVQKLEKQIDIWESILPSLQNFILPGGGRFAAQVHMGRSICRRAERSIIAQHQRTKLPEELLQYINRLSDWLFTLARFDNFQKKIQENIWEKPQTPL